MRARRMDLMIDVRALDWEGKSEIGGGATKGVLVNVSHCRTTCGDVSRCARRNANGPVGGRAFGVTKPQASGCPS